MQVLKNTAKTRQAASKLSIIKKDHYYRSQIQCKKMNHKTECYTFERVKLLDIKYESYLTTIEGDLLFF